jgi:hypothetical protein
VQIEKQEETEQLHQVLHYVYALQLHYPRIFRKTIAFSIIFCAHFIENIVLILELFFGIIFLVAERYTQRQRFRVLQL